MTESDSAPVVVGCASEKGPKRPLNADAFSEHLFHDRLAIAVVDGTGSTPAVAEFATLAAGVAVRVAARHTPALGILAASELNADPTEKFPEPDGAIIVAVAQQDQPWLIAWAGDCVAYGWSGESVHRLTSPHTAGQRLRDQGADEATARAHDRQLFHGIGRVTVGSIPVVQTNSHVVVLSSDGLKLSEEHIANILAEQGNDLPLCAKKLIVAARTAGSKDDVTVVVAAKSHPGPAVTAGHTDQ